MFDGKENDGSMYWHSRWRFSRITDVWQPAHEVERLKRCVVASWTWTFWMFSMLLNEGLSPHNHISVWYLRMCSNSEWDLFLKLNLKFSFSAKEDILTCFHRKCHIWNVFLHHFDATLTPYWRFKCISASQSIWIKAGKHCDDLASTNYDFENE